MSERILIVDDDENVLKVLSKVIQGTGMESVALSKGEDAVAALERERFDLMLLDINMPGMDGFEVLKKVRTSGLKIPIVFISGRQDDPDVLYGLSIGADDYITKPFNPVVVSAKAKALIRRSRISSGSKGGASGVVKVGPFAYDPDALIVSKNGKPLDLTAKEMHMAKLFIDNPGRIFPTDLLYELVWKDPYADSNTVRVYINKLRAKMEDDPSNPLHIINVRGLGYKFMTGEGK